MIPPNSKKGQGTSGILSVMVGGIIAVSIITILFMSAATEADNAYSSINYDDTEYSSFSQSNEVINITQDLNDQFTNLNGTGTGATDIISVTTTGGYNAIRLFSALPAMYFNMFINIGDVFDIPEEVMALAALFILLALIGLFILLVFRVVIT